MQHKLISLLLTTQCLWTWHGFCTEACSTRWSIMDSLFESFSQFYQPPSNNNSADEDYTYKYELTRIENRMMSVALRTIVDFMITSGALEFSCSKLNNSSNNSSILSFHADTLDCQKYHTCHKGEQVTKFCQPDQGFNNKTASCAARNTVPLCQSVHKRPDFNCSSTGLQPHDSDCKLFVLCTKSMAYEASCNLGDFFDQSLLICLPSQEAEC